MSSYFGTVEAVINFNAGGINNIVELPAPGVGFAWRILGFILAGAGAVSVTVLSGSGPTTESGPMNLIAGTPFVAPPLVPGSGARYLTGVDNGAIALLLSAAVQVSGILVAEKVPSGS